MYILCWSLKDYLYNFDSEILLIVDLRIAAFDDLTSETSASTAAMHSQNPHPPSGSRWEKTDATERPQLVELCDEQWNVFVIFHRCKLTLYNWLLFKEYHELQLSFRNDWHQIRRKQTMNDISFYEYVAHMFRKKQSFGCIVYIFIIH